MKAARFMRKPFIVTGYLVDENNMDAIAKWCQGHVITDAPRPFVRVPVDRPTNKKQTEAYVGTWVLLSIQQGGGESFKVYTDEWLERNFIPIPREIGDDEEPAPRTSSTPHPRVENNVRTLPVQGKGSRASSFRAAT